MIAFLLGLGYKTTWLGFGHQGKLFTVGKLLMVLQAMDAFSLVRVTNYDLNDISTIGVKAFLLYGFHIRR